MWSKTASVKPREFLETVGLGLVVREVECSQSMTLSPVLMRFQMRVPMQYKMMETCHTSSQLPDFRIMPVAAVPRTPARTPAVLDKPRRTPEYRGAMSCRGHQGILQPAKPPDACDWGTQACNMPPDCLELQREDLW